MYSTYFISLNDSGAKSLTDASEAGYNASYQVVKILYPYRSKICAFVGLGPNHIRRNAGLNLSRAV